jgi:hypothetical protein
VGNIRDPLIGHDARYKNIGNVGLWPLDGTKIVMKFPNNGMKMLSCNIRGKLASLNKKF